MVVQTQHPTKESLTNLYEETFKSINEGAVVRGTVVAIRAKEALIDIGYKSEGVLPLHEFPNPANVKVGDTIEVLLETSENDEGMVVLSKQKADKMKCWNDIVSSATEGGVVEGKIFKKVRGGFMVDVGMEAFLPASLVDLKPTKNLDQFVGMIAKFKVVKVNQNRKNIVVSRKDFLESERAERRTQMLDSLEPGQCVKGRVKNITDFGAFIDLGGVDGLLHITDMSWGRVSHPSEVVKLGEEIEVVVVGFDRSNGRISLGLKQRDTNPWENADTKYPVGERIKGRVVNIVPYGAFVELEKGIEGLVHVSELSWTKRVTHPSEVLAVGNNVEVMVLSLDKEARKIALGIKQTETNPWDTLADKYHAGDRVHGAVRNLTDYGAFVELEPGIGGLLHISDMTWVKKLAHPSELLHKGQEVEVQILTVDAEGRKIALGLKQLSEDPWGELVTVIPVGEPVSGRISKIVNFGLFVTLPNDLEGLVHVSEIPDHKAKGLEEHFRVGQPVTVIVLKIDDVTRKIALSLRGDIPEATNQ